MNIVRLMLLSRQMKNRRHEKNNMVTGIPPLTFTANKTGLLKNYRIYGNTETKTRSYSGSAPLSFPIMDGAVSNYRIYGNTENGESVGERTKNLLDINNLRPGAYAFVDGVYTPNLPGYLCTQKIPCEGNTTYVFSFDGDIRLAGFIWYDENDTYISSKNKSWNETEIDRVLSAVSPINAAYLTMDYASRNSQDTPPMTNAQIEQNTDKSSYEPYGYKISITNNNENANIYLDAPLRKVGTYTDYTDYENQKVIRIVARKVFDGTENEMTSGYNQIVLHLNTRELLPTLGTVNCISNHIIAISADSSWVRRTEPNFKSVAAFSQNNIDQLRFTWNNSNGQVEFEAFKAQLAEWYANGNPLIVDCIIKTPVEEQVTLPALPAQSSTNSFSVGTIIQPSSVAVDVDEVVSCGDKVTDSQSVNYGKYKIPVTLTADSAETTDIYLDEPLAKSGNNADYVDYAAQRRYNADGTESSVTLPEIVVAVGTNTLTVGTEVQPSRVELTGRIKEGES